MTTHNRAPSHVGYSVRTRDGQIENLSIAAARHVAESTAGWSEILSEPVPLTWWGPDFLTATPVRWRESFMDGSRYDAGRCS